MTEFLLALRDDPSEFTSLSPEEIQSVISEYVAWATSIQERGHLRDGKKLRDEGGKILRKSGEDMSVVDGPFSESKEVLGGFYVIEAPSYEAAAELCSDHPQLKYGGSIELRAIEDVG